MDLGGPTLLGVFFVLTFLLGFFLNSRLRSLSSPPGPPRVPIIGHATIFPKEKPWEQFHAWSKELGSDVIELNILGISLLILDSAEAAHDLLEKRSSIYSGRPRMPMVNELMGWDFNFGTMEYGSRWRSHRKTFESSFTATAVLMYEPQQVKSSRLLLLDLLHSPKDFLDHFRQMAGSIILGVAYGIQTKKRKDPFIGILEAGVQPVLEAVVPGTYLVDLFPVMKFIPEWMPFARFQRVARETRALSQKMLDLPFEETKRMMAAGGCPPSFVSSRLQNMDVSQNSKEQEIIIKNTAASMYSAGTDNIIATLAGFVIAMLSNPSAQSKAQTELDTVISAGHLPTFADMDYLPYVTALTIEVFRCAISSPIGAPHELESDDAYRGYGLKKKTIVFANVWAILHDPDKYPDPFAFKPERFLKDGKLSSDPREIVAAFGFGRRICPGRHMAFSTVWMAVASILAAFNISKASDKAGNPVTPELKYSKSSSCLPAPFDCVIAPRNSGIAQILAS